MDVGGRGKCWVIVLDLWGGFTRVFVFQRAENILLIQFCRYSFGDIMVALVNAALEVEEALNIL